MNCTHYTVCCWIAMAQNEQEMLWASQQLLAHNSCWGETNFPQVAISFLFGLFRPWYKCICDRFDWRQCCDWCVGIFKWNFDNFFVRNCVWNMKESGLTCGSHAQITCRDFQMEFWSFYLRNCVRYEGIWINMWLSCTVNVQHSVGSSDL